MARHRRQRRAACALALLMGLGLATGASGADLGVLSLNIGTGAVDPGFGGPTPGWATLDLGWADDTPAAIAFDHDNELLVLGHRNGGLEVALARYDWETGGLDHGFGQYGLSVQSWPWWLFDTVEAGDVLLGADHLWVAGAAIPTAAYAGAARYEAVLAQYRTDGTLDTTKPIARADFDRAKYKDFWATVVDFGFADAEVTSDGDVVLAGTASTHYGSGGVPSPDWVIPGEIVQEVAVAMFKPDGTPHASFGQQGQVVVNLEAAMTRQLEQGCPDSALPYTHARLRAVDVYENRRYPGRTDIVVAGMAQQYQPQYHEAILLVRLHETGELSHFATNHPRFGHCGVVVSHIPGTIHSSAEDVVVDDQGNIVVVGWSDVTDYERRMMIARFLPDGSEDPSFGAGGVVLPEVPESDRAEGYAVDLDDKGRITVVGEAEIGGELVVVVGRFLPDGRPDPFFEDGWPTGVVVHDLAGSDRERATDLIADRDLHHIVVLGQVELP